MEPVAKKILHTTSGVKLINYHPLLHDDNSIITQGQNAYN